MSNEEQSKQSKAAETLKEVYQDAKNQETDPAEQSGNTNAQQTQHEFAGSDADTDETLRGDDQPTQTEATEQLKGSDADKDQSKQP